MAKVNVVKGSVEEQILKKQYGDNVSFNYTDQNQFAGADRGVTNLKYQDVLGKPINDAGNLWDYSGVTLETGGKLSDKDAMKASLDNQLVANTNLYNTQAAEQAAKIRQAIASQTQQGEATKTDYTNNMNAAIGTLNTEKAKIPGQVTNLNNATSSQGVMNAQKIRNALNQMGLLQSGESASQQLLNDTTVANNVNANNLQGQELDMGYGNQIASAQTDLASKTKQINDAIALAMAQGDENALYALKDAQAKIADAGAKSAVDYNNWAYTYGRDATNDRMTQQEMDARAIQDAITNTYNQSQADLRARQWEDEFAAKREYENAALARSGSSGMTATEQRAYNTSDAYADVDDAVDQGTPWETIYANITNNAAGYVKAGLTYESVLKYAKAKYDAAQSIYAASQSTPEARAQRSADAITKSAFTNWYK